MKNILFLILLLNFSLFADTESIINTSTGEAKGLGGISILSSDVSILKSNPASLIFNRIYEMSAGISFLDDKSYLIEGGILDSSTNPELAAAVNYRDIIGLKNIDSSYKYKRKLTLGLAERHKEYPLGFGVAFDYQWEQYNGKKLSEFKTIKVGVSYGLFNWMWIGGYVDGYIESDYIENSTKVFNIAAILNKGQNYSFVVPIIGLDFAFVKDDFYLNLPLKIQFVNKYSFFGSINYKNNQEEISTNIGASVLLRNIRLTYSASNVFKDPQHFIGISVSWIDGKKRTNSI